MKEFYHENKGQLRDLKQKEKEELLEFATSQPVSDLLATYKTAL
jgi:hypothetical protein